MNFLKKYGLYFAIILVTTVLGTVGYVTESRKEKEAVPKEITYVPKLRETEKEAEEVMSKKVLKEEATPLPVPEKVSYVSPVKSEVMVPFSGNKMIFSETMDDFRTHEGADYVCNVGEEIVAAANGEVTAVFTDEFLGLCIEIIHPDKTLTRYCGLSKAEKKVGDKVKGGEGIAISGNSTRIESAQGVHLHFEAEREGKKFDPQLLFE